MIFISIDLYQICKILLYIIGILYIASYGYYVYTIKDTLSRNYNDILWISIGVGGTVILILLLTFIVVNLKKDINKSETVGENFNRVDLKKESFNKFINDFNATMEYNSLSQKGKENFYNLYITDNMKLENNLYKSLLSYSTNKQFFQTITPEYFTSNEYGDLCEFIKRYVIANDDVSFSDENIRETITPESIRDATKVVNNIPAISNLTENCHLESKNDLIQLFASRGYNLNNYPRESINRLIDAYVYNFGGYDKLNKINYPYKNLDDKLLQHRRRTLLNKYIPEYAQE